MKCPRQCDLQGYTPLASGQSKLPFRLTDFPPAKQRREGKQQQEKKTEVREMRVTNKKHQFKHVSHEQSYEERQGQKYDHKVGEHRQR